MKKSAIKQAPKAIESCIIPWLLAICLLAMCRWGNALHELVYVALVIELLSLLSKKNIRVDYHSLGGPTPSYGKSV